LTWRTVATIFREDKYVLNRLRPPLFVIREVFASLFPPRLPPPRE
jgi:hypothetical protein